MIKRHVLSSVLVLVLIVGLITMWNRMEGFPVADVIDFDSLRAEFLRISRGDGVQKESQDAELIRLFLSNIQELAVKPHKNPSYPTSVGGGWVTISGDDFELSVMSGTITYEKAGVRTAYDVVPRDREKLSAAWKILLDSIYGD